MPSTNTVVITVNMVPTITMLPSSNSINIGQSVIYTANIPTGTGTSPFTVDLMYNGNVVATNSILDMSGNSVTLAYTPVDLGTLTFNAIATDTGTTPFYVFNTIPSTITVNPLLTNSISNVVVDVPANTPTSLNYMGANAILTITSSNGMTANVLISNVTTDYTSKPSASSTSFTKLVLLDFSVTNSIPSNVVYSITISIPCGSNAAPYKLYGSTWTALPFTTNTPGCTITFSVPADPVIGIFTSSPIPPPSPTGVSQQTTVSTTTVLTTVSTTIPTTTASTTILPTTTVPTTVPVTQSTTAMTPKLNVTMNLPASISISITIATAIAMGVVYSRTMARGTKRKR